MGSTLKISLADDYWETYQLQALDVDFLYNLLLENEMPLSTKELVDALIPERIRQEQQAFEKRRAVIGDIYQPKEMYSIGQPLVFPAMAWQSGKVIGIRPGVNPDVGEFQVIEVAFDGGGTSEFAAKLAEHVLNEPIKMELYGPSLQDSSVLDEYGDLLVEYLDEELETRDDFVRIAGKWFPRTLLVDISVGHLNLAEAVLDMAAGGPLPTADLIDQIELKSDVNPRLLEFSMDWALQNDPRFDEVGPAGEVFWFLNRLEPAEVLEPPVYLRYPGRDYDRSKLTDAMLGLEKELDDELSAVSTPLVNPDEVEIRLIYPHWRAGTLPLSSRVRHLFPTAYESPRIRFMLVDGESGEKFPGWVVRDKRYVFGLRKWYELKGLIPGGLLQVKRSKEPGEVILKTDSRRGSREWMRTVLVGSDGGIVFAMLKQYVSAPFDDRMAIAVPDVDSLDRVWGKPNREPMDRMLMNMVREIAKLNPQGHVHASELYAAINIIQRMPPAPILAQLASHPGLVHVGDLHFRPSE